jgi:flavin-dependent dehydrogenase
VFKTDERTRTALSFSERASPGAYGYLATAGGHGVLASVIVRPGANPARCLNETRRIFDHAFPDLPRRRLRRFGGAGCFALPRSYSVLGRFYAGEAAGLQDALWGFGMRQAILSGRLAALAVLGEIDYDEELRRQILPQMVTTLVSRAGLDRLGPRATELLLHAWVLSQRILGDGLPFLRRLYGGRGLRHSVQGLARRTLIDAEHAHPALGMRWLPLDRAGA